MSSTTIIWLLSFWLVASSVYRFIRRARAHADEHATGKCPIRPIRELLMLASAMLLCASVGMGARLFFTGGLLHAWYSLGCAAVIGAAIDTTAAVRFPVKRRCALETPVAAICSLLVAGFALGFVLYLRLPPLFANEEAIALSCPVHGKWIAVTGGRTAMTNYHHGKPPSQSYAVDLVRRDGPSQGVPIFAPVGGMVVTAEGDRTPGSAEPEGNIVIIETSEGVRVWLAHLQRGSVQVRAGDTIETGQMIARCGATGSADRPHLHIHAQRGDTPVAMRFGRRARFLVRNDRIASSPNGPR